MSIFNHSKVKLKEDIWDYLESTLLPSVYHIPDDETDQAQFYLSDLTTAVIGVPRIRQLRVDHGMIFAFSKKILYEKPKLTVDRN